MTKTPKTTRLAFDTLQARLSLKETQLEFATRFRVSRGTVNKWENGVVEHTQRIYREILLSLLARLKAEGRLVPDELVYTLFKEDPALVTSGIR